MTDIEKVLEEGRRYQKEKRIPLPPSQPPSLKPWIFVAGFFVLLSLGIEVFWPLPARHGPLPMCQQGQSLISSCQKNP